MPQQTDPAGLRLSAYAKVNLSLEILGKRPDGFHELVSVSQLISLADRVEVSPAGHLKVTTSPPVVEDEENLVRRAAEALALATGRPAAARIALTKRIPLAAGLGGGSSDATATLRLLDRLWGTQLSADDLARIAATLGSDLPLFLGGGTTLMRGRGEQVEALPAPTPFWLVLVNSGGAPPDKTRALYRALRPDEWSDGSTTLDLAARLRAGASMDDAPLVNSFDGAAARVYPSFAALRQRLQEAAGLPFHLTGAGPTLFARCSNVQQARAVADTVGRVGITPHVARTVARRPAVRASKVALARSPE